LDAAYAQAMREVWRRFPADAEVGALCAEALMDLHPWDLWTNQGQAKPWTPEIVEVLERVLALAPQHPLGNHLYVHAMEASNDPGRANAAADRLRTLVPGSSHLVHMPAHIDIRLGHYLEAIQANQRAIVVDQHRTEMVGAGGFYAIYRAHNYHFLAWAAMFDGASAVAMHAAREMVAGIPPELVQALPNFLDGFMAAPLHVMVRFGKWDDILDEPKPPAYEPATVAVWHYARGLAYSARNRVDEAKQELAEFERAFAAVPDDYTIGNNTSKTVLAVARPMLAGEIAYRLEKYDEAFARLREAVALDDALHYDEPWGWMQPARHALGALLLEQGRVEEAEAVYRRDLEQHPENGWSLFGLVECLRRTGRDAEADVAHARFRATWPRADVIVPGSCFCRTGG
jgi:tetratricopeptide (TPR) repeat protein